MNQLQTIAKIGEAALLRMFKPHCTINALEQHQTSVEFPKGECNLFAVLNGNHMNQHFGEIQMRAGRGFLVWGIELGLHSLGEFKSGETVLDLIVKQDCLARMGSFSTYNSPSHFIVRDWSSNDVSGDKEAYTVYRLTPKQEKMIQECAMAYSCKEVA